MQRLRLNAFAFVEENIPLEKHKIWFTIECEINYDRIKQKDLIYRKMPAGCMSKSILRLKEEQVNPKKKEKKRKKVVAKF